MTHVLRVLDAARAVVNDINRLCEKSRRRLLHENQLRNAAQSICTNIREAFGRRRGPERNQFLRYARASGEEADEHLRTNWGAKRIETNEYWRLHNRLVAISKIITSLMTGEAEGGSERGSEGGSKSGSEGGSESGSKVGSEIAVRSPLDPMPDPPSDPI